jgi:hypothetical protein
MRADFVPPQFYTFAKWHSEKRRFRL